LTRRYDAQFKLAEIDDDPEAARSSCRELRVDRADVQRRLQYRESGRGAGFDLPRRSDQPLRDVIDRRVSGSLRRRAEDLSNTTIGARSAAALGAAAVDEPGP